MASIGERIDAGLLALGRISQAELARRAGLPAPNYVSRIKSGELTARAHIEDIAKVLGCDVEWLTAGTGPSPRWGVQLNSDPSPQTDAEKIRESQTIIRALTREIDALRAEVSVLRKDLQDVQVPRGSAEAQP